MGRHPQADIKDLDTMNSVRIALLACATASMAVAAAPRPAEAQSAIKVVVNGEPVTTNEINQRARFLRLVQRDLSGEQLVKQATEELVEERLKAQEAKRMKLAVNEQQVDAAIAQIAQRVKLSPDQLRMALGQQGIDFGTLRGRIRSQVMWQQLVVNRFSRTVSITDSQIVAALEKQKAKQAADGKAAEPVQRTTAEYAIRQVTFVVPRNAASGEGQARLKQAEAFRARVNGCDSLVEVAKSFKEVVVKNIGKRTEDELPPQFRGVLADTAVGKVTKPVPTPTGVEMLAVCERRDIQGDFAVRGKVEDSLREQEGQLLARQYITELRRIAVIDYKR